MHRSAVYALSIHADYGCRRSGACCTSDWDVPVEVSLYPALAAALRSGRLRAANDGADEAPPLVRESDLPDNVGAMASRTATGDCVFYHRGSGLCVIHRDLGEPLLPATCRHFPRLAVRDRRGAFITLTHYCPTAAAMLFREDVPLEIVAGPPAFPPAEYEGLIIDPDAWPPLLHPRMLMDLDGYSAWERHMVARCADPSVSAEDVIATLVRDAGLLRRFSPGNGSLVDAIASLPADTAHGPPHRTLVSSLALFADVIAAVPDELRPAPAEARLPEVFTTHVAPYWHQWAGPLRRYVAAKAFASWTAYQGRGLLSIVRGLEAALAVVRVEASRQCRDRGQRLDADLLKEAFRQADFALNHLAVGEDLAAAWSRAEE